MSRLNLYADLTAGKLVSRDGGTDLIAQQVLGDTLVIGLRLMQRVDGSLVQFNPPVRTVAASLGRTMEPPASGLFTLRFGIASDQTAEIAPDSTADALKAAIQALPQQTAFPLLEVASTAAASCWLLRFDYPGPVPLAAYKNTLAPTAFVRVRAFTMAGVWWHELRLIQAPLAFSNGFDRVLADSPSVRRIRGGALGTETQPPVNELQALTLPPEFRGTYFLRWNYRISAVIGEQDGPDEIAAALNKMFGDGKVRFAATNPEKDNAYIEFVGPLSGMPQEMITAQVNTFEPGVITFVIPLDRAELAAALRDKPSVDLPFEIELELVDDGADAADPAVPGRPKTIQGTVRVVREQIWKELATVQAIDWLTPPAAKDYIPFTRDQVIVGTRCYSASFGDGALRTFVFPHNFGSDRLTFSVRENASGGAELKHGTDYTLAWTDSNQATLTIPPARPIPALNSLAITLIAAGPIEAFQAHTHTIAQIIGLVDALASLTGRLATIEDLLPSITPAARIGSDDSLPLDLEIPDCSDVFPGRRPENFDTARGVPASATAAQLPRPGVLLPAIHSASVSPLATPLPSPASFAGRVFQNNSGVAVMLPGGGGVRSRMLAADAYAGSDGRVWYPLERSAGTNSFFPIDFERELFRLPVNSQQLARGKNLTLDFTLALQLFNATSAAQFLLVIEVGDVPADTLPAPTDPANLKDVQWHATPLCSQRVVLTGLRVPHKIGCQVIRSAAGILSANQTRYGYSSAAGQVPASADFALRARLIQFDTEDSMPGARGTVFYALTGAKSQIS